MSTLPHHCVYARLGASKIHGVGVFAIMPIPKGTVVFAGDDQPIIWIKITDSRTRSSTSEAV